MFDLGFKEDDIVKHDVIIDKAKCGCMGGIRYSKQNNIIILFMKSKSRYDNSWEGDTLKYMGAGKGNQFIERNGNIRIAESKKKDTDIFLFEWIDGVNCKYIGKMVLTGTPYYEKRKNEYGDIEQKLFFKLKKVK